MSALSDPRNADFGRRPDLDGDVRDDPRWQRITGLNRQTAGAAPPPQPAADPPGQAPDRE
jgi:hypothetical protein